MVAALTLVLTAATAFAPSAVAAVGSDVRNAKVNETGTVRIHVVNDGTVPLTIVGIQIPPAAVAELLGAAISDRTWIGSQDGIFLEWQAREPLPAGESLDVRLRFRFREVGEAALMVRVAYADGSSERAPIGITVAGAGDVSDEVVIVSVLGAAILVGSIAVFVFGRRRLRA